jgi:polysaccharide biosynthesis PFTS motif protein
MNWPHYLVWDEYQANFVRRAVGVNANISVVGSIWFQSNAIMMPKIPKQSVAVFDVTPYRDSLYQTFGLDNEFYTPTVVKPFLQHVFNATQKYNFDMLWKRKRNVGRIAHPHYRHLANQLSRSSHVILVEPEISAIRVIESSVAVISLPFTSTAIIAKEMGKPSIYYDPTGLLHKDDRAAHGITIISTRDELDNWLSFQKSTISV